MFCDIMLLKFIMGALLLMRNKGVDAAGTAGALVDRNTTGELPPLPP
jgi:hypothetical protein